MLAAATLCACDVSDDAVHAAVLRVHASEARRAKGHIKTGKREREKLLFDHSREEPATFQFKKKRSCHAGALETCGFVIHASALLQCFHVALRLHVTSRSQAVRDV